MVTLRSVLHLLFMWTTIIFYALPISTLGKVLPLKLVTKISQSWGRVNLWGLRSICGLSYRIQGKENMPSSACIVLCKHQSTWEAIALHALLPPEHAWVVKRELLWIPLFGWSLAALRPIAIDRGSVLQSLRKLIDQGKHRLDKGRWVIIFPEGTRVAAGQRRTYNQGGAVLACKTGYPVLPVAHNAGSFWRRRGIRKYPGEITLAIGKPLNPAGLSPAEVTRLVEEWIEGTVEKLEARQAAEYGSSGRGP